MFRKQWRIQDFPKAKGCAKLLLPPVNEVCEGYVFTPVCQSFCSQRGGGQIPPSRYTPQAGTPPGRYTPRQVHPLASTPPGRYTPLAGTPPGQVHPLGAGTPPWQVHLLATVHAGIWSTSGQYASHWNAFLFRTIFVLKNCMKLKFYNCRLWEVLVDL